MSRETALCVTDVGQEYEYMERVRPYNFLKVVRQSVEDGIDCLEFEPNIFGVERLYFEIHSLALGGGKVSAVNFTARLFYPHGYLPLLPKAQDPRAAPSS